MKPWWYRKRRGAGLAVGDNGSDYDHTSRAESSSLRFLEPLHGLVWVDNAGKIRATNPQGAHGRYAVLVVPDGDLVRVTVNGKALNAGEHVIEERDRVQVRMAVQAADASVDIHLTAEGMEATLTVNYKVGERLVLAPTTPSVRLVLWPDAVPIEPSRVTLTQVRNDLARAGVVVGVVAPEEIQRFLERGKSGTMVVARGTAPRPGAGSLEIFEPDGLAGAWQVETGTIIGRRRRDPARPGVTVTGTSIPAPAISPGHETFLGPGVVVMDHGTHLVASRHGQVVFSPTMVDVVSRHECDEITPSTEVLMVEGDLKVHGSIRGRLVVVSGNLSVAGDIRRAEIVAGGGVEVRGSTEDSAISMGLWQYAQRSSGHHVTRIIDGLYDLELTIQQLEREAGALKGHRFGQVLYRIASQKFTDVSESITWLQEAYHWPSLHWSEGFERIIRQLGQQWACDMLSGMESLESLMSLRAQLEFLDTAELVHEVPTAHLPFKTRFHHVLRSHIEGQDELIVDSAHATRMTSRGVIRVQGPLVGGFLSSQSGILADQLGSESFVETSVEVTSSEGVIEAQVAYPGVVMVVAGERRMIDSVQFSVHVGVDEGR